MGHQEQQILGAFHPQTGQRAGGFRADPLQRIKRGKQRIKQLGPAHVAPIRVSHASSSMTLTPCFSASLALDPAPGPATSRFVLAETEPATLAPKASARAFASARGIFSQVPVKTTGQPATGPSPRARAPPPPPRQ